MPRLLGSEIEEDRRMGAPGRKPRMLGGQCFARPWLLDALQHQARFDQAVDVCRHCSRKARHLEFRVALGDGILAEAPALYFGPLIEIAADGERFLAAVLAADPANARGDEAGMQHAEGERA